MSNIPTPTTNYLDIIYKVFWTAISAGGGLAVVALADIPTWWALPLATLLNAALAYVRQQLGETPPILK